MGVLDLDIKDVYAYRPSNKKELVNLINSLCWWSSGVVDLNMIDVSGLWDLSGLFFDVRYPNVDISQWNVSNAGDLSYMFMNSEFNGDISKWDVRNVEDMSYMFSDSEFNGDISKWDVSNVKFMESMFDGCKIRKLPPGINHNPTPPQNIDFKAIFRRFKAIKPKRGSNILIPREKSVKSHKNALKQIT